MNCTGGGLIDSGCIDHTPSGWSHYELHRWWCFSIVPLRLNAIKPGNEGSGVYLMNIQFCEQFIVICVGLYPYWLLSLELGLKQDFMVKLGP